MTFEEIKEFYVQHKDDKFEDSEWNEALVGDLFMKWLYYRSNYKIINKKYKKYWIYLPMEIDVKYGKTWNEIKKFLWIKEINRDSPMTLEKIKEFYIQHKDDKFEDSEWNEALVGDLFVKYDYYKKNYKIVSQKYKINLPSDIARRYDKTRNEIKEELGINI